MIRACLALTVWVLVLLFLGLPVFLIGLVYPSRWVMAWLARIWSRLMLGICGVRLTIEGREAIADGVPRFYVGNHQSDLDIPVVIWALYGDVRFMAKDALFRIPIFGWVLWRYGFVPVDRANARRSYGALGNMVSQLRKNPISFAVFPEGTRSPDGRLLPFRRGTLKVCQRSGLPVVPFSIQGTVDVHHRDHFLDARPAPVRLVFAAPIPADEVAAMSAAELYARVQSTIAHQLGEPFDTVLPADAPLVVTESTG